MPPRQPGRAPLPAQAAEHRYAELDRLRADAARERDELRQVLDARAQALDDSRAELRARADRADRAEPRSGLLISMNKS